MDPCRIYVNTLRGNSRPQKQIHFFLQRPSCSGSFRESFPSMSSCPLLPYLFCVVLHPKSAIRSLPRCHVWSNPQAKIGNQISQTILSMLAPLPTLPHCLLQKGHLGRGQGRRTPKSLRTGWQVGMQTYTQVGLQPVMAEGPLPIQHNIQRKFQVDIFPHSSLT